MIKLYVQHISCAITTVLIRLLRPPRLHPPSTDRSGPHLPSPSSRPHSRRRQHQGQLSLPLDLHYLFTSVRLIRSSPSSYASAGKLCSNNISCSMDEVTPNL